MRGVAQGLDEGDAAVRVVAGHRVRVDHQLEVLGVVEAEVQEPLHPVDVLERALHKARGRVREPVVDVYAERREPDDGPEGRGGARREPAVRVPPKVEEVGELGRGVPEPVEEVVHNKDPAHREPGLLAERPEAHERHGREHAQVPPHGGGAAHEVHPPHVHKEGDHGEDDAQHLGAPHKPRDSLGVDRVHGEERGPDEREERVPARDVHSEEVGEDAGERVVRDVHLVEEG